MSPKTRKKIFATLSLTTFVIVTAVAIVFMVRGEGLRAELDFGAGAYYYADIPDYDKLERHSEALEAIAGQLPLWGYIVIFLAWGALMYWLWTKI